MDYKSKYLKYKTKYPKLKFRGNINLTNAKMNKNEFEKNKK